MKFRKWRKNRIIEAEKRYTKYLIYALFNGIFTFLTFCGMLGNLYVCGSVSSCSTGLVCVAVFAILTHFFLKRASDEEGVILKLTYEKK